MELDLAHTQTWEFARAGQNSQILRIKVRTAEGCDFVGRSMAVLESPSLWTLHRVSCQCSLQ